jgi:hypothetical protein
VCQEPTRQVGEIPGGSPLSVGGREGSLGSPDTLFFLHLSVLLWLLLWWFPGLVFFCGEVVCVTSSLLAQES